MLTTATILNERYQLQRKLGVGGFSEVWSAQDIRTGREVAVKAFFRQDEEGIRICRREYERTNRMYHPKLIRLFDFDVYQKMPYLVMPYFKRGSLSEKAGDLDEETLWRVAKDIGTALEYLHGLEPAMIHNDLKPDNFLISDKEADGYILTDFGISAELTDYQNRTNPAGVAPMAYRAPELFEQSNEPAFPIKASDIWALGACLYELACGDTPFGEQGGLFQLIHHREYGSGVRESIAAALPAHYSARFTDLIYQCLHLEPWKRPKAKDLLAIVEEELERIKQGGPSKPIFAIPPPIVLEPIVDQSTDFSLQVRLKRRNVLLGLVGVLGILLGLTAFWFFKGERNAMGNKEEPSSLTTSITPPTKSQSDASMPDKKKISEEKQSSTAPLVEDDRPTTTKELDKLLDLALKDTKGTEGEYLQNIKNNIDSHEKVCQYIAKLESSKIPSVLAIVEFSKRNQLCTKGESSQPAIGASGQTNMGSIRDALIAQEKKNEQIKWGIAIGTFASVSNARISKSDQEALGYEIIIIKNTGNAFVNNTDSLNKKTLEKPYYLKNKGRYQVVIVCPCKSKEDARNFLLSLKNRKTDWRAISYNPNDIIKY